MTAEGFAAGDARKCGHEPGGLPHRGSNRRMRKLGRVGPFAPLLHIRKLITQRGDGALSELRCNGFHEWMEHSRSRPMRQDVAGTRLRRDQQQAGNDVCVIDPQSQRFHI